MELLKKYAKKVIKHQNTIKEEKKDEKDRGIQIFKYLRPFIIKLFFHSILIFLSIRAYLDFLDSSTAYDTFKNTLNEKVVLDIKIQDYEKECDSGYENIESTYFPAILNGCRCKNLILPGNLCSNLRESNYTGADAQKARATCVIIDRNLNNSTAPGTQKQKRNLIDLRNMELDENNEFKSNYINVEKINFTLDLIF